MTTMSDQAKQARNEYFKQLRDKNRPAYNQKQREWAKKNPDKVKLTRIKYWEKVAARKSQELA